MSEQKSSTTTNPENSGQDLLAPKDDQKTIAQRVITPSTDLPRRPVDANSKNFDFQTENQTVCLINLAHKHQKCKSDCAALRIVGAFKTKEKALKHSAKLNSDLDVFVLPMHSWFPITQTPTTPETAERVQQATVQKVEKYISSCGHKQQIVEDESTPDSAESRIEESKKIWERGQTLQKALDEASKDCEDIEDGVPIIPRMHEVRGQTHAVISIVAEADMDDEPAINVLRIFESKEDARDYLRNTVHIERVVTNCYVVQMYEWITPVLTHTQKFFENVDASFTHTQLEQLHSGKKEEQKKIEGILAAKGKTLADVDAFMAEREAELAAERGDTIEDATVASDSVAAGIHIIPVNAPTEPTEDN